MRQTERFLSVRPYLAHALVATASVIVLPLLTVFALLTVLEPDPPVWVAALAGVIMAVAAMAIGTGLWMRRPASADIGYSDLMLWRWLLRRRAEETLEQNTRLLGLDRSGRPVDNVRISAEQQLEVLKELTEALESKDPYTHGHSQRVERHSFRTGLALGLSAENLEDLRKAAALHDVGKIRVPDRILRKAASLTAEERAVVEEHAVVGAWMVSSVGSAEVINAVRHHHERWDGRGYPDGLAGHNIPMFARVIAVADSYDAITSTRPYRAGSGRDEALEALRAGSGAQFDPGVVEAFVSSLPSRAPIATGIFVLLGGPERVLRELAVWFRRFGAGSLAPAAGATGAAIVLGASIFTPSTVEPRPPALGSDAAVATTEEGGEREPIVVAPPEPRATEKPDRKKRAPKKRTRPERDAALASEEQSAPADDATVSANEASGTPDTGGSDGSNPEPTAEPTADDPPQESPTPAESTDNRNDHRDDCPNDGNAGGGNDDDC